MTHAAHRRALERRRAELRQALGLEPIPDAARQSDPGDEIALRDLRVLHFATDSQRRETLRAIDEALDRIATGRYGTCLGCQGRISEKRLAAVPWTPRCTDCQVAFEQQREALDASTARRAARIGDEPGDGEGIRRRDITPPDQRFTDLTETC